MRNRRTAQHHGRGLTALTAVTAVLALAGCTPTTSTSSAPTVLSEIVEVQAPAGVITAEVARSDEDRERGLSSRPTLPDDRGMLFIIDPPEPTGMWMPDMRFPLDIVFIRDGRVTEVVQEAAPCTQDPCETFTSTQPVDAVLEIAAGQARTLGLDPGASVTITDR